MLLQQWLNLPHQHPHYPAAVCRHPLLFPLAFVYYLKKKKKKKKRFLWRTAFVVFSWDCKKTCKLKLKLECRLCSIIIIIIIIMIIIMMMPFCPWWLSRNGIRTAPPFLQHSYIAVPPASLQRGLSVSSKPAWETKLPGGFGFYVPNWWHPLSQRWTLWPHDNELKIQLWSKKEGRKRKKKIQGSLLL